MRRALLLLAAAPLLAGGLAACGGGDGASEGTSGGAEPAAPAAVTVYSGRNEALIGPLFERFTAATGIPVEVRYGDTAELAATLLEEGAATPAHVFVSQDAAALGALADAGRFQPLPAEVVERVAPRYRDPERRWVGLSGRARTLVYNTDSMTPEELPATLEAVGDPRYRGRFGVAPLNASFQAQIAVYHALEGRQATEELLRRLAANEPKTYANNSGIVQAVIQGEIDFGLVNHYYLWRALQEQPGAPAANHFQTGGGAASYVNLAGAGLLAQTPEALELLRFLVEDEAQRYFAEETFEYPLAGDVPPAVALEPLASLEVAEVDPARVAAVLEETLTLIHDSGLTGP